MNHYALDNFPDKAVEIIQIVSQEWGLRPDAQMMAEWWEKTLLAFANECYEKGKADAYNDMNCGHKQQNNEHSTSN
jgi:hypothetical protein